MRIVIERSYLNSLGYDGHSLYLNDPHCRPHVSYYQVVFNFPINSCGTVRKVDNSSLSGKHHKYTALHNNSPTNYGWISRHWNFECGCFWIPFTLSSLRTAELCIATPSEPTPPTPERSRAKLTWSWMWTVEWSRTRWPRLCTLSIVLTTAASQAQADSIPPWTSTHQATSTIRCVQVVDRKFLL